MARIKTQVSRADILRLLAASRTASADAAAQLAGYQPEQESTPGKEKRIRRSQVASHTRSQRAPVKPADAQEISRELPMEAFWYISERRSLKKTVHRLSGPYESDHPDKDSNPIPALLYTANPLTSQELSLPEVITSTGESLTPFLTPPDVVNNDSAEGQGRSRRMPSTEYTAPQLEGLVAANAELAFFHQGLNNKKGTAGRKKKAEKKKDLRFRLRLRRILGLLSVTDYADLALLQHVIHLFPSSCPEILIEAALLSHADLERYRNQYLLIKKEKKKVYQRLFALENSSLQAEMVEVLRQSHADKFPLCFAHELLTILPLLHSTIMQKQITVWLESFMSRFVRTWFEGQENIFLAHQAAYLLEFIKSLPSDLRKQVVSRSFLYGIVQRKSLRSGAVIPREYDPETVIQAVRNTLSPISYQILQQGEQLFLYPTVDVVSSGVPGSSLIKLDLSVDCLLLHKKGDVYSLPVRAGELVYDCTKECREQETALLVQTPMEQLIIGHCFRPSWACAIGRNRDGLFVDAVWLGRTYRLIWQNSFGQGRGKWAGDGVLQTDQFGLFVDFAIKGPKNKQIIQRFRRITPGCFFMGSPEDEPERESWGMESLHEVILTKGFWVADTAVTQELWQMIMGGNPSHFKGNKHPVEQVSYLDAQLFLQLLNEQLQGIEARLLTEAEWEYCCRAGTITPFSFGTRITPEQVNYNGQYPYHTGGMGKNRQKTIPVQSLPCNTWGLYEMHGNVWEWCHDYWQEDLYHEGSQIDPQGPEDGEFRVVRGGSWFLGGRGVRSAVRGKFAPHFSNSRIGFRIALSPAKKDGTTRETLSLGKENHGRGRMQRLSFLSFLGKEE